MENKEFRNALVKAMKNELNEISQKQKELKKSRKLEFRPKNKSLQSICDEISNNASRVSHLIFYYRWIKHGLKYWANQEVYKDLEDKGVYSANDYFFGRTKTDWFWKHSDEMVDNVYVTIYGIKQWVKIHPRTRLEIAVMQKMEAYRELCIKYGISFTEDNIKYIFKNN